MRAVYDLVKCNPWQYFCTQTVSAEMCSRGDLAALVARMSRGVADQNKRAHHRAEKIRFLWVPELHADGDSWHLHGVMSGLSDKDLRRNKNGYLEWAWSADRVGFFSLSAIRSRERCATYVRKYMTKNIAAGGVQACRHLYFCSKGLNRPIHAAPADVLSFSELGRDAVAEAGHVKEGEWATTCTLQGAAATSFLSRWGDVLEVVG
jgi:hypothetical protein